jgi:hypothetical protein
MSGGSPRRSRYRSRRRYRFRDWDARLVPSAEKRIENENEDDND